MQGGGAAMKLVGLMPCRNEAHVLGLSARVALKWCDELVIGFHACFDASLEIHQVIRREGGRIRGLHSPGESWTEMQHRQQLLEYARGRGATHIAIIDADEILTGNLIPSIRAMVEACPRETILTLPGYNMRGGIERYHSNGIWGRRWFSTAFADDPRLHWACEGYDHHHREPRGVPLNTFRPVRQGTGGVMHLWGVPEERLKQKHRFYRISERLKYPSKPSSEIEAMYSMAEQGRPSDRPEGWTYAPTPAEWWEPYADLMKYLDVDADPWQRAWCDEQIAKHGREHFAGLVV
jgi:hypothetical protein